MKKIILSSSLVLLFSIYILNGTPNTQKIDAVTPAVVKSTAPQPADPRAVVPQPSVATTPPPQPAPTPAPKPNPAPTAPSNRIYSDGVFTGSVADAYYGNVQVQTTIQNGRITDVQFLQYPNDRKTSQEISSQAMPALRAEVIQAQNAQVDIVSGATQTSLAFQQSLADALNQAKI